MTKILAPSNVGYFTQTIAGQSYWGVNPSGGPIGPLANNPTIVASFKSALAKADRRRPTDYTRMIGKVIGGGPVDAKNKTYWFKSSHGFASLRLNSSLPYGCSYPNGTVNCPSWMIDQCIASCRERIQGISANIFEDLAQLKQAGDMILDLFIAICQLFADAVHGKWKGIRDAFRRRGHTIPRHIANGWLMFYYGVKPMISTIEAVAMGAKAKYKTEKVRSRREIAGDPRSYINSSSLGLEVFGEAKVQAQCQLSVRIRLDSNLATWQNLGWTEDRLNNLIVTSWALIPYSFVVDWILPVETWLRNLVWAPFLEYQGGFTGVRHVVNADYVEYLPWYGSVTQKYSGNLPHGKLQVRFYKRKAYLWTLPPNNLSISLRLSETQLTSAVALVTK